jgi:hypothetical protein
MLAIAGMLANVVKPAAAGRQLQPAGKQGDYLHRDDSSRDFNSSRTARIRRKVSNSKEMNNMQQGHRMPDAGCQIPEMLETVCKPQAITTH